MTWEQGFCQGELDAYRDRQAGRDIRNFEPATTEAERGYLAGYHPRSATWWVPTTAQAMRGASEREAA